MPPEARLNGNRPAPALLLTQAFRRAAERAAGILFPDRCAACRTPLRHDDVILCADCRETLVELPPGHCPVCALPDTGGIVCPDCAALPPPFTRTRAGFIYGAAIADAIRRLKYQDAPQTARRLAALCIGAAREDVVWCGLLVPVPLHPSRLHERGFNQSALLARALAQKISPAKKAAPFALRRIRATRAQVGQSASDRQLNVRGAFWADERIVRGQKILLVDDVMTTGATAREAAKALNGAGAAEVRVFCAARAAG